MHVFGSRAAGLSHSSSDIDMVTMLPFTPELMQWHNLNTSERGFLNDAIRELEALGKPRDVLAHTHTQVAAVVCLHTHGV